MVTCGPKLRKGPASVEASRLPTIFLPHGGGHCFFMDWSMGPADTWDGLAEWLRGLAGQIGRRPRAVVLVSAHWEEPEITIGAHPQPPLIFDYYGFPQHTYELEYPAPGDSTVASRISELLTVAGIPSRLDAVRGLDHGVFVPLKLVYPDAEIPIVPLSLRHDLDAEFHQALGKALEPLRSEDVLIVGSGMSFHNMSLFGNPKALTPSRNFHAWLASVLALPEADRWAALADWKQAPDALVSHPRAEHFLPLLVVAGAAGVDEGNLLIQTDVMDATVAGYGFGAMAPAAADPSEPGGQ